MRDLEEEMIGKTLSTRKPSSRSRKASLSSSKSYATEHELSFEDLYEKYSEKTLNLCKRVCPEWAEECHQELWLTVYLKRHTFNQEACFSTWIYRIAYNSGLMRIRKDKHYKKNDSLEEMLESDNHNPALAVEQCIEEALHSHQLAQKVVKLLKKLHKSEQVSITNVIWNDLSHEESARLTKVSLPAQKSAFFRGKMRLRDLYLRKAA